MRCLGVPFINETSSTMYRGINLENLQPPMLYLNMMLFTELECLLKTTFFHNMDLECLLSNRKLWSM